MIRTMVFGKFSPILFSCDFLFSVCQLSKLLFLLPQVRWFERQVMEEGINPFLAFNSQKHQHDRKRAEKVILEDVGRFRRQLCSSSLGWDLTFQQLGESLLKVKLCCWSVMCSRQFREQTKSLWVDQSFRGMNLKRQSSVVKNL